MERGQRNEADSEERAGYEALVALAGHRPASGPEQVMPLLRAYVSRLRRFGHTDPLTARPPTSTDAGWE